MTVINMMQNTQNLYREKCMPVSGEWVQLYFELDVESKYKHLGVTTALLDT